MFWKLKEQRRRQQENRHPREKLEADVPKISVTLPQVKKLVHQFEQQLPKGINRTVLLGSDNEIRFDLLSPYMEGAPDRKFYMSRQTFEIFDEEHRHIPTWLDIVQQAVDDYIDEKSAAPTIPGDSNRKISYPLLLNAYFLKSKPPLDFYLTDEEGLITHRLPRS